ncbi:MAG: phage GP46 family protein [Proteobacteria bacterium]|nr:phage GP46 family protein [Pseudomonadota bacterium]
MKVIDVSKIDIYEVTDPKLQLILICLFTDGYVNPDQLPPHIYENRGWWGDSIKVEVSDRKQSVVWGSDLWVYEREKLNDDTLVDFKERIKRSLKIAVDAGIIEEPEITVTRDGDRLDFVLGFKNDEDLKFEGLDNV